MNGILLVDKPSGWTSSDVVAKLRGMLHERRIGHSGTLDPMATGLLVVFVGRATRAVEFAESHSKSYSASIRLGLSTDTQDITGHVLSEKAYDGGAEALCDALKAFRGDIEQIPPMYSAIKMNGKKLYEIARRGGEVERKPRRVNISSLELSGGEGNEFSLEISCSKGTYIRTLCADIGQYLGCGACMSALRRTRAGDFSLAEALSLEEIQRAADRGEAKGLLIPVDRLFMDNRPLTIDSVGERLLRCGNPVPLEHEEGVFRVYSSAGDFLALARQEQDKLKTIKSFFEV